MASPGLGLVLVLARHVKLVKKNEKYLIGGYNKYYFYYYNVLVICLESLKHYCSSAQTYDILLLLLQSPLLSK